MNFSALDKKNTVHIKTTKMMFFWGCDIRHYIISETRPPLRLHGRWGGVRSPRSSGNGATSWSTKGYGREVHPVLDSVRWVWNTPAPAGDRSEPEKRRRQTDSPGAANAVKSDSIEGTRRRDGNLDRGTGASHVLRIYMRFPPRPAPPHPRSGEPADGPFTMK